MGGPTKVPRFQREWKPEHFFMQALWRVVLELDKCDSIVMCETWFATVYFQTKLSLVPMLVNGNSTDSKNLSNGATLTDLQNKHTCFLTVFHLLL